MNATESSVDQINLPTAENMFSVFVIVLTFCLITITLSSAGIIQAHGQLEMRLSVDVVYRQSKTWITIVPLK